MRGDQLTLTAVQLIGLVDSKLIGAVHKIGMIIYAGSFKVHHLRISVVDSMLETAGSWSSVIMYCSDTVLEHLVFVIGCVLMRRRHSFDSRK